MDNSVCNFQVLENPNRRYANTVNLVFFKAIPLTKNFSKYTDGLKNWKNYMKAYPNSQLQIFVDEAIADDSEIINIMRELNARVILFKCPDYLRSDGFHKGLFGTMVRFFPMFDINSHALSVAHIQELEPDMTFTRLFPLIDKVAGTKIDATLVYITGSLFEDKLAGYHSQPKHELGYYPWIIAGRFFILKKLPFSLMTTYLKDIVNGKQFFNQYVDSNHRQNIKKEHNDMIFGIDEIFLNNVCLPWLINNGHKIGILSHYTLSYPVYYSIDRIKANNKSKDYFNYILNTNQELSSSLKRFDSLFYNFNTPSEYAQECAKRFFKIISDYPNWVGKNKSELVLKYFNGILSTYCLVVFQHNKIIDVKLIKY